MPYTAGAGVVDACPTKCTGTGVWNKFTCKASSTVTGRTVASIQSEIQANGPMETGFTVYSDFMNYKEGIYTHVSGA